MKRIVVIFLAIIFLLGFILRLYQHSTVPPDLYWDEVSIGYNAYSILETGKDEWGVPFPVIFKAFGEHKFPGYIYLTVPFVYLLGLTETAVRLPSIIFGSLTIIVVYALARKLKFSQKAALIAPLLLAFSPWHLQFSRAGFEAVVSLFFLLLGIFLFITATEGKLRFLFPAMASFLLAIYTYQNSSVIIPLISPLIVIALIALFRRQNSSRKIIVIASLAVSFVMLTPYLQNYVLSPVGRTRASSENIFRMKGNLLENFSFNFTGNFSLRYLFTHGDQNGRHSVKKNGQLYSWQILFVLIGLFTLLKSQPKSGRLIIIFLLAAVMPATLTTVSPHALRSLPAVIPYTLITAIGLAALAKWKFPLKALILSGLTVIVFYQMFAYLHLYYFHAKVDYALDWQYGFRETVDYLKTKKGYDHVYLSPFLPPIYLMFYLPVAPKDLQKVKHDTNSFGNYTYDFGLPNPPEKNNPAERNLVVLPAGQVGDDVEILREIRLPSGDPFMRIYEY